MTRTRASLLASLGLAATAAALSACVLPDRGIGVVDERVQNKHPARFVEPTPVTNEAANGCLALLTKQRLPMAQCQPSEPAAALPSFLDPAYREDELSPYPYRFCSCDVLESDNIPLKAATLYVEDRANQTSKGDGDGLDPIYAALQLDLRPDDPEPQGTVAYISYVDPSTPLEPPSTNLEYAPPLRPNAAAGRALRELNLGFADDNGLDLCNGASATPLAAGFHTLRVIITDAPWYTPPPTEDGDNPVQQFGVPDITAGATYDTITYVFHCDNKVSDDDAGNHCDERCKAPE